MSHIKLAFFDIDGTLIGSDGEYSEETKQAILLLKNKGIGTAIASGRPPFAAQFLFDELEIDDVGLFYAGAAIYDPRKKTYLKSELLTGNNNRCEITNRVLSEKGGRSSGPTALNKLIEIIKHNQFYCEIYTLDGFYTETATPIYEAHSKVLRSQATIRTIEAVLSSNEPIYKLLIGTQIEPSFTKEDSLSNLRQLESDFSCFDFAYAKMASHPKWIFASITSKSSCRHAGFKWLCDYHNVEPAEVIAFGDAQSDMIFIESAGIGVAMGDAPESVKKSASIVTETADNNGVARVIQNLFA